MTLLDVLIVVGVLVVTSLSLHLIQRYWSHSSRQAHNDVAGFIFAAVGVLYAVLLAFVIIAVWESIGTARDTTYREANQLANVYWISRSLPLAEGAPIEKATLAYAHTVIDDEWPLMANRASSPNATALIYQIRTGVFGFQPQSMQQQVLYNQAVTSVNALAEARRDRLDTIGEVIPTVLWLALIVGGAITVGFCLLFGIENKTTHIGMVTVFAAMVVLSLLLIKDMEYPFGGAVRIGPEAFEVFLSRLPAPR
jgi:hypothetical protein